jgi:ribose 5-phosphate isomerase RpiB
MALQDQTVYLGGDMDSHEIKQLFKDFLKEKGVKFVDLGMFDKDTTDFATIKRELGEKIESEANPVGVLIFGKKNNV